MMLVGCLTTYAAGPTDQAENQWSTPELSSPTFTPDATVAHHPAVTLVPNNLAAPAFQVTSTATETGTPTDTPSPTPTDTATPEPTTTSAPTNTPQPTETPTPTNTPRPTALPTAVAPFQAYAWVDNYYPMPGSVVTVYGRLLKNGRPVNGAQMGVTFGYTHGQGYCTAYSGIDGRAACAHYIGYPLQNYWVFVDVVFIYEGELYYAKSAFLTDP
jgi:hypothetical protein